MSCTSSFTAAAADDDDDDDFVAADGDNDGELLVMMMVMMIVVCIVIRCSEEGSQLKLTEVAQAPLNKQNLDTNVSYKYTHPCLY